MSHIYTKRELNKMRKEKKAIEEYFEKSLDAIELANLNDLIHINIELQTYDNM